jgi:serine/threonine protein kinase
MVSQVLIAGRYEIKEPLGEGGMGVVYRAIDIKTKSYVALKTMRDISDPVAVELFSKEWSVLAGLSHPNIVDIRDVGEIDDHGQKKPFFVMPLLPGSTLAKLIETSSTRLTVERVVAVMSQVCRGLQAAHEQGLVHRDIKPSNIFVMEDDTAKIIDFGVVHLAGSHSVTGQKGTWQYMAPEQIDMKPASPASDIFSLGVVCYEALTGRKPFARKTPAETAEAVRSYIPAPIIEINPMVSQLVSMVIHKAMAKLPFHRFSSVRDFGDSLQKAHLNQPIDRFDRAKIQPRIERAKKAFAEGDIDFASEILTELETEGHIDPEIKIVRLKINQAIRQKKIRQLLEAARTRAEQDEIPLALEKLHEVLEIDPDNADAHALRNSIDQQQNDRQVERWMSLAQRHLERHDFSAARLALAELLRVRPSDSAAIELRREINRSEEDALHVHTEKEQLYDSAVKAFNNGEISTALSKLERLLELGGRASDAAAPDRDATYQSLYNEVRSQRDSIRNAYEEARRHLAEKDFARALDICDEFVAKYPNDPIFQALKIETVEKQRQELSGYTAEIGRRLDAEPDLDRKVNIIKEACERYPHELQFQQSLKLTRERRDLVLSIVTKARYYEEKNLFTEAIGQWDILRNIYSVYPGIEIEVDQLKKRRDQQVKEESKARLIDQIDRSLDSGDFARARDQAASALTEYPQDQELVALERLARQGLERSSEAWELYVRAQALRAQRQYVESAELLSRAMEIDPKNSSIREALVDVLTAQARPLLDVDWRAAEPLIQRASEIEPAHPDVRSMRVQMGDLKRKEVVSRCLAETRDLQAAGDLDGALAKLEDGLSQYPSEARLLQLQATLQNLVRETRSGKERVSDVEELKSLKYKVGKPSTVDELNSIFGQSQAILRKHPDDLEVGSLAAEIQHLAGVAAPRLGADASIFSPPTSTIPIVSHSRPQNPPVPPSRSVKSESNTRRSIGFLGLFAEVKMAAARTWVVLMRPALPGRGFSRPMVVAVAGLAIVGVAVAIYNFHKGGGDGRGGGLPPPLPIEVQIQTKPPDATVTVKENGKDGPLSAPESPTSPNIYKLAGDKTYDVVVSRVGYKPGGEPVMRPRSLWSFILDPEPLRLSLATSDKTGTLFIDNLEKGQLQDGVLQDLEFPVDSGEHTVALRSGNKDILSFSFTAKPGELPQVTALQPKDLLVVSSLANEAIVFSASNTLSAALDGQDPKLIPPEGLKLDGVSSTHNEVVFKGQSLPKIVVDTGKAPTLYIVRNADTNIAYLTVEIKPETARLSVDGREKKRSTGPISLKPGSHTILVHADGYQDNQQAIELTQGQNRKVEVELRPIAKTLLIVAGGTPGADILIDGASAGTLDNQGAANIEVGPGMHRIRFQKQYFQPSETSRSFPKSEETHLGGTEAKLKEFGTLQFQVTPADARVTYQRNGQTDPPHSVGRSDAVRVPEGTYIVTAEATGFKREEKSVAVSWGQPAPVEISLSPEGPPPGDKDGDHLVLPPASPFEDRSKVTTTREGWWLIKTPTERVFLKATLSPKVTFDFLDPGKSTFIGIGKQKNVEWVIHYLNEKQKVEYTYDWKKLTLRAFSKGKPEEKPSVPCASTERTATFTISIQPHEIAVENAGCKLIYHSDDQDLTQGKIGIKTPAGFHIPDMPK